MFRVLASLRLESVCGTKGARQPSPRQRLLKLYKQKALLPEAVASCRTAAASPGETDLCARAPLANSPEKTSWAQQRHTSFCYLWTEMKQFFFAFENQSVQRPVGSGVPVNSSSTSGRQMAGRTAGSLGNTSTQSRLQYHVSSAFTSGASHCLSYVFFFSSLFIVCRYNDATMTWTHPSKKL